MESLSRLLYLSTAAPGLEDGQVRRILEVSRQNNARLGVTGVLVMGGGHFIQVLEGSEHDLIRLYSKIIDDMRHGECTLIGLAPIEARLFQNWSMGYIQKSAEAMAERRHQLLDYRIHHGQGEALVRIMQRFVTLLKQA